MTSLHVCKLSEYGCQVQVSIHSKSETCTHNLKVYLNTSNCDSITPMCRHGYTCAIDANLWHWRSTSTCRCKHMQDPTMLLCAFMNVGINWPVRPNMCLLICVYKFRKHVFHYVHLHTVSLVIFLVENMCVRMHVCRNL